MDNEDTSLTTATTESYTTEDTISMCDVEAEQAEQKRNAKAVLGPSDVEYCSFKEGYKKRQALYSCKDCVMSGKYAGICLACSLVCHDGHNLVELYTKRNFKCDCGNAKFDETSTCQLTPKTDLNDLNKYGHNFEGLYCSCNRAYPDPDRDDDSEDEEMIQCVVCEDWFHFEHLQYSDVLPDGFEPDEIACSSCCNKYKFLYNYNHNVMVPDYLPSCKRNVETENNKVGTVFFQPDWRKQLCHCENCLTMYAEEKLNYLLDLEDSIEFYESLNKSDDDKTEDEILLGALAQFPRVQQTELLHGFSDMKEKLAEFLANFKNDNKVVTAEDIQGFFEDLKAKRPRIYHADF